VSIIPTVKGIRPQLEKQFAPVNHIASTTGAKAGEQFSGEFDKHTSQLGGRLGNALKVGIAAATAAVGAAGAIGVKTAAELEQADIAFTTMLGSGEKAKAFLGDLNKFAARTPFDLPGLQKSASSLISVGIDANKVIPIMTSLGNATSGMGTGAEGVKRATVALQQMQAAGRITGEDLNQLRDAGVPVFELLAAATGKTVQEVAGLAQAGKLGKKELDQLFAALESGKGLERFNGLMEKQSQSLSGLWSTAKDAFTIGMAEAVQPVIPLLKDGLGGATSFLTNTILPAAKAGLQETIGGFTAFAAAWKANDGEVTSSGFPGFMERVAFFIRQAFDTGREIIGTFFAAFQSRSAEASSSPFFSFIATLGAQLGIVFGEVWKVFGPLIPQLQAAWQALSPTQLIFDALMAILPNIVRIVGELAASFGQAFQSVLPVILELGEFLRDVLLPAIVGFSGFLAENTDLVLVAAAAVAGYVLAAKGLSLFFAAKGFIMGAVGAVQALNVAMRANPIGIVITLIGALVAGLIWFFTQTELGRDIIANVWSFIQTVVGGVIDWFSTNVLPVIQAVFGAVGAVFTWLWESVVQPVFGFIAALIGAWWEVVSFIFRAVVAIIEKVVAPVIKWLWENVFQPVFDLIGKAIDFWWNRILLPVFTAVWDFLRDTLGPVFTWLWENIIKPAFDGIGATIGWVWEHLIKPVFETLKSWIGDDIPKAFGVGVKIIEDVWKGIQDVVKAPIKFVVEVILNKGLIGAFNAVAGFLQIPGLPEIQLPEGFAKGGYTGDGRWDEFAGMVHRGEFVFTKEQTRILGKERLAAMAHAAVRGTAYAGSPLPGSQPFIQGPLQAAIARNRHLAVVPLAGYPFGRAARAADAWSGRAGVSLGAEPFTGRLGSNAVGVSYVPDIPGYPIAFYSGQSIQIEQGIAQEMEALIHEVGHALGLHHATGQRSIMHPFLSGANWPTDYDSANLQVLYGPPGPGARPSGGGGGWNPISDIINGLLDEFKKAFPAGGFIIDIVGGVAKAVLQGVADFIGGIIGGDGRTSSDRQVPMVYDGGGWLEDTGRAMLVRHHGARPDAVLTAPQWDTMLRIAEGAAAPTVQINGNVYGDPQDILDEIEARQRRAAVLANLGSITVGG
jgi:tape measure domain-containing protein